MLGECPWREPNSHVRLFSAPKVLELQETILREDTLEASARGFVRVASTNDVIQVYGRLSLECLVGLVCGAEFTIGLLCEMNLMLNKPKVV